MSQKVIFVPVYIGSLKYYEKLLPFFPGSRFLIIRANDKKREQIIEYCEARKLPYDLLQAGFEKSRWRLPLLTPLFKYWSRLRAAREYLLRSVPTTIVATRMVAPYDVILRVANFQNIDTVVLQWSFIPGEALFQDRLTKHHALRRLYYWLYHKGQTIVDGWWGGSRFLKTEPHPRRVGVIDEVAKEAFSGRYGFHQETIQIVGLVDFQLVAELKDKLAKDAIYREVLLKKYALTVEKKKILVLAQAHHLKSGTKVSAEVQLARYQELLVTVREVFTPAQAEVILKLHPSDTAELYQSYHPLQVKIFSDEADTAELICLADLTISDAWTSANYTVVAAGASGLFLNMTNNPSLTIAAKKYYGITNVITSLDELQGALQQFAGGTFKKQYRQGELELHPLDKIKRLVLPG